MGSWWKALDQILRGEATRLGALRGGRLEIPTAGLMVVVVVLGVVQGVCMGTYGLFKPGGAPDVSQVAASALKVPLLFVLTLLVTLPSLYVSNALVGSRLSLRAVVQLLVAALGVMMAVLASLGPIVAFFGVITTSHPFMVLLNVAVFSVSGFLGLGFLLQTLHRMNLVSEDRYDVAPSEAFEPIAEKGSAAVQGALSRTEGRAISRQVRMIFRLWVILFGLVGAQMSWVLRPFIGRPGDPFILFAGRESNFFEGVFRALGQLFS